MKRTAYRVAIVILGLGALGLLAAGGIGCGPRSPFESGDWRWSLWGGRHGFHGKNLPDHILSRMDERVETLNLTQAQKEQYKVIREKARSDLTAGREARQRLVASIRKEMGKELPDLHQVASLISERAARLPEALDKGMNRFLEFYEILDETQKAKVVGLLKDRLNRIPVQAESTEGSLRGELDLSSAESRETASGGSITLSQQDAQMRGDRHGELL
jgi:Spy/CpxP family protein refolding chaperone